MSLRLVDDAGRQAVVLTAQQAAWVSLLVDRQLEQHRRVDGGIRLSPEQQQALALLRRALDDVRTNVRADVPLTCDTSAPEADIDDPVRMIGGMSTAATAAALQVSERHVRRLIDKGALDAEKTLSGWRVDERSIGRYRLEAS